MKANQVYVQVAAGVLLGGIGLAVLAVLTFYAPWLVAALVVIAVVVALIAMWWRAQPAPRRYSVPVSTEAPLELPIEEESVPPSPDLRVLVVGPTGQGKTWLGLSIIYTMVFGLIRNVARILGVSPFLREQYRNAIGHGKPDRTPATYGGETAPDGEGAEEVRVLASTGTPIPAERLLLRLRNRIVEFLIWAGEDLYLADGWLDVDALLERMSAVEAKRVLLITNPFKIDATLSLRGLLNLTYHFTQKGFSVGRSVELASVQLFGIDRKGLMKLRVGYQRLAEALRAARVRFDSAGRSIFEQFVIEGVSPAMTSRIQEVLERIAVTVVEQSIESNVVQEVAARLRQQCILVGTHADLLPFIKETVSELDLRKALQRTFPPGQPLRSTQVIVQGSMRLQTSSDPKEPVWVRGPAPTATELLESTAAELGIVIEVDRPLDEVDSQVQVSRLPAHALLPSWNGVHAKAGGKEGYAS